MGARPPSGEPAPTDGSLPATAVAEAAGRPLSLYVHVPFCASRCGYCDFNTYTAAELGSAPGVSRTAYLRAVEDELDLAARVVGEGRPVSTVFFGGGTPTLLSAAELGGVMHAIRRRFDLVRDVEVTTEANPESVTPASLAGMRAAGINRISFGMQSAVPHVLATLDRVHTPGRVPDVVAWARSAGFGSVSLDLIYGAPGESLDDWRVSLEAALACDPDHVSAYALIVEEGTRLAARIRRGELAAPDDDLQADAYLLADRVLNEGGLGWYELSNWARPGHGCRHNLAYWCGDTWWGIGPGAHSHAGGVRWWNVRHPRDYSARLAAGTSPAEGREVLDEPTRRVERILLESRLSQGLALSVLDESELRRARVMAARPDPLVVLQNGALVLTLRGRLLADAVVRELLD